MTSQFFATCASKKWWQSIVGQLGFLCDSTFYKLLIDCVIRLAVKTKMSASNVCQQKNWSQKDEHDSTLRWMSKTDMYRVLHKNLYAKLMKNFQMTRERRQPETGAIERHVWSDIKNLFFQWVTENDYIYFPRCFLVSICRSKRRFFPSFGRTLVRTLH